MTLNLFISYRSTDAAHVDRLVTRLKTLTLPDGSPRYAIWQDKHNIIAGEDWWGSILNAIEACHVFVLMLSPASATSPYCRAEVRYAYQRNRHILPVLIQGAYTFDAPSDRYTIAYWDDVPPEVMERRAQFLYDDGASVYKQFSAACDHFTRLGFIDIRAERPPNPDDDTRHTTTDTLYALAYEAAHHMDLVRADKGFRKLLNLHDPVYREVAVTWLNILGEYQKLVQYVANPAFHFRVPQAWAAYKGIFAHLPQRFIDFFDPQGLQAVIEGTAPPPPAPPRIEVTPQRGGSQTQAPLPPPPTPTVRVTPPPQPPPPPKRNPTDEASAAVQAIIGEPFAWCEVPAGPFLMGIDRSKGKNAYDDEPDLHEVTLPTFWIGKYPITYRQFQTFVEARDGYHDDRWWQGLAARADERQLKEAEWPIAKHPREAVNWYESMAFCRWLSQRLGGSFAIDKVAEWAIRLPIEAEWEKAARGTKGRIYPWGDTFDEAKCNTDESGNGQTTPVDRYPQGASPYEVLDMSGNVWEWCLSEWTDPYEHRLPKEINITNITTRVLRGGSWLDGVNRARAARRASYHPHSRFISVGFRVVRPPSFR